jgi:colanic acid/amylovoran biosynthesis glycosyltransferase
MPESTTKLVVLHSTESWLPQTHTWMYNQVHQLPSDVESHILCRSKANLDQFGLPNIHSFGDAGKFRNWADRVLRRLHLRPSLSDRFVGKVGRRVHAQILHSNFGPCGCDNLPAARQLRVRHVVSFYGTDASRMPACDPRLRQRYGRLFKEVDCVLAEGPHLGRCLAGLGCPTEKIRVQHLGVCVSQIRFVPRYWEKGTPLKVLIAASFREKKGIPYALRALGQVAKRVPLEITIIGDAAKQELAGQKEKAIILETITKEELKSQVRLLGYQPYKVLFEEAYRSHLFISPSVTAKDGDTEGGAPVSLIEMAATGLPIVSTRHCDIPEVIPDPSVGLLAEERNVAELVQHLLFLIEHPETWPVIGANAHRHVEREYDAAKQGLRLGRIYQELLTGRLTR